MDSSLKQEFTRRLTQCNKGELIVIMYDILFAYLKEARDSFEKGDYEAYKVAVRKAQNSIDALKKALDFSYEISRDLYKLYVYCKNLLARSMYQKNTDCVDEAEEILKRLYTSFCEVAKTDTSGPLMRNTQQVYAGITYGRLNLNESYIEDSHRGFFV